MKWFFGAIIAGSVIGAGGVIVVVVGHAAWGWFVSLAGIAIVGAATRMRRELLDRKIEKSPGATSAIQQRMALDRSPSSGRLCIGFGVLFSVLVLAPTLFGAQPSNLLYAILTSAMFIAIGSVQLVSMTGKRKRFEQEFGRDAGKQQAVRTRPKE